MDYNGGMNKHLKVSSFRPMDQARLSALATAASMSRIDYMQYVILQKLRESDDVPTRGTSSTTTTNRLENLQRTIAETNRTADERLAGQRRKAEAFLKALAITERSKRQGTALNT